jgi:hypothetical protein
VKIYQSRSTWGIWAALFVFSVPCCALSLPADEDLFPTKPGATWTYTGSAGTQPLQMDAVIVSSKSAGGTTTVVERWSIGGNPVQDETYLVTAAGVSRARSGKGGASVLEPPLPIIKYPMKAGKSWKWEGTIATQAGGRSINMKADCSLSVSPKEKVKCGAGDIEAFRVDVKMNIYSEGKSMQVPNSYWFAPGIGLIKQSTQLQANGKSLLIEAAVSKYKIK